MDTLLQLVDLGGIDEVLSRRDFETEEDFKKAVSKHAEREMIRGEIAKDSEQISLVVKRLLFVLLSCYHNGFNPEHLEHCKAMVPPSMATAISMHKISKEEAFHEDIMNEPRIIKPYVFRPSELRIPSSADKRKELFHTIDKNFDVMKHNMKKIIDHVAEARQVSLFAQRFLVHVATLFRRFQLDCEDYEETAESIRLKEIMTSDKDRDLGSQSVLISLWILIKMMLRPKYHLADETHQSGTYFTPFWGIVEHRTLCFLIILLSRYTSPLLFPSVAHVIVPTPEIIRTITLVTDELTDMLQAHLESLERSSTEKAAARRLRSSMPSGVSVGTVGYDVTGSSGGTMHSVATIDKSSSSIVSMYRKYVTPGATKKEALSMYLSGVTIGEEDEDEGEDEDHRVSASASASRSRRKSKSRSRRTKSRSRRYDSSDDSSGEEAELGFS